MASYTITLNSAQERRLEQLRRALGATTKPDTIKRALAFLAQLHNLAEENPALMCKLARLIGDGTGILQEETHVH